MKYTAGEGDEVVIRDQLETADSNAGNRNFQKKKKLQPDSSKHQVESLSS